MADPTTPDLPDLLERHHPRRPLWVRALCVAGGVVFFALGVLGWLVPLVSGIPFYVLSLMLFGMASDRVRQWINRAERRLPHRVRVALRRALGKRGGGHRGS